ncbi:response regulator receiver protein [Pseudoalteromonas rubra]|uniref:response regulator receiver protein n=1 Tax=Pseudoalteromonas rubra TaxID=43658 RepID=UPI000F79742B|nr:response regulator receiver protein [Pseudoalteromonas rubra]
MTKNVLSALVMSALSFGANASGKWHESKIHTLYPTSSGGFVITFKSNAPDCAPNTTAENKYHYVEAGKNAMTPEGVDKVYSLALMAAASDKSISIFYDSTSSMCYVNRAYVKF